MSAKQEQPDASKTDDNEDRSMEFLEPIRTAEKPGATLKQWLDDDEDTRYFMSEPSVSTDGDHNDRNVPAYLLSPQESLSEASLQFFPKSSSPPPPMPNQQQQSAQQTLLSSPGNTSLSSRDSPHLNHKVHLQFMQDKRSRLKIESTPHGPMLIARPNSIRQQEASALLKLSEQDKQTDNLAPSSRSTSSNSLGQQQRAADFLQDLKLRSIGALEDANGLPSDFESVPAAATDRRQIDTVIRRQAGLESNVTQNVVDRPGDETVVMVLSESDGEKEEGDELEPLDWEHQHSADDEQTMMRPRRVKRTLSSNNKSSTPGHRRTRSGDGAAATLMNHGIDWKGMQHDKLPMPQSGNYETEDDESQKNITPQIRKTSSGGASSRHRVKQSRFLSDPNVDTPSGGFTIGSPGKLGQPTTRRSRKPPRQRRGIMERNDPYFQSSPNIRGKSYSPRPHASPHDTSFSNMAEMPTIDRRSLSDSSFSTTEHLSGRSPQYAKPTMNPEDERFMNHLNSSFPEMYMSNSNQHSWSQEYSQQPPGNSHFVPEHSRRASFGDVPSPLPEFVEHQRNRRSQYGRLASDSSFDTMQSRESMFSWISERGSERTSQSIQQESIGEELQRLSVKSVQFEDESEDDRHISGNQLHCTVRDAKKLEATEQMFENKLFRGKAQNVLRPRSPIVNGMRRKGKTNPFKPVMNALDGKGGATFVCPQCGTRQRAFFTASTAPTQMEGPASYLALYFGLYVVASLYIFGLEEGWKGLDCVYFAVITLTTAGLGDLVPTSDSAKIICSIFIYFGVACIGLLLGTYLAGMLDERNQTEAMRSRVDNCVVCSRVKMIKTRERRMKGDFQPRRRQATDAANVNFGRHASSERSTCSTSAHYHHMNEEDTEQSGKRRKQHHETQPLASGAVRGPGFTENSASFASLSPSVSNDLHRKGNLPYANSPNNLQVINGYGSARHGPPSPRSPFAAPSYLGSPMTTQILGRQKHTRHQSFDVTNSNFFAGPTPSSQPKAARPRKFSVDVPPRPGTIEEGQAFHSSYSNEGGSHAAWSTNYNDADDGSEEYSMDSEESEISVIINPDSQHSKVKTAKYVLLTLKQALMNSIFIIAIGSIGFYYIESMTVVDSFYFTTVLLTTVGYGDIAPVTNGGKLFATVYVLGAGTVLLHNMSLISMIPLELRKRRIEKAVLSQFGDQLDDAALRELATGPLVQRLQLSTSRTDGLDECTREMFALAMLVRLGKVTERDVKQTFAMFRRLDVDNEGVLNSRTIITGMMHKRKSMKDLQAALVEAQQNLADDTSQHPVPPPPPPVYSADHGSPPGRYWFGDRGSLHVATDASTFRFADVRHDSMEEYAEGEQASLLNGHGTHPFTGGTFGNQDIDEEGGLQF